MAEPHWSAKELNADLAQFQSGGSVRRQRQMAGRLRSMRRVGAKISALGAANALGWWWQARQTRLIRELAETRSRAEDVSLERVLQLYVARGMQRLEVGVRAGSLSWFAAALPPVAADTQRAMAEDPRVSDDGRRLLRLAGGTLETWELSLPAKRVTSFPLPGEPPAASMLSSDGRTIALFGTRVPPVLWKPDQSDAASIITLGQFPADAGW